MVQSGFVIYPAITLTIFLTLIKTSTQSKHQLIQNIVCHVLTLLVKTIFDNKIYFIYHLLSIYANHSKHEIFKDSDDCFELFGKFNKSS